MVLGTHSKLVSSETADAFSIILNYDKKEQVPFVPYIIFLERTLSTHVPNNSFSIGVFYSIHHDIGCVPSNH